MKPTTGRIVHFVQEKPATYQPKEGPRVMVNLPAIVTAVWGETCVNLQVFTDGTNSDEQNMGGGEVDHVGDAGRWCGATTADVALAGNCLTPWTAGN